MKAYAIDEFGKPGSVREVPDPEPGEGEVRVNVGAASVNPFDAAVVNGYVKDYMEHRFPLIPSGDLAGTVDAVGVGVTDLSVGDRVFGTQGKPYVGEGTLAENAVATAGTLALTPESLSDREAAALGLAAVSALMAAEAAEVSPGDVVVVVGASGGIGSYAVQIAAVRGAHVVGVTSSENVDYVRGLGAAEVVDRKTGDVLDALRNAHPEGVAAIIDTSSDKDTLTRLAEAVRDGGHVVSMKGAAAEELAERGLTPVNLQTQTTTERLQELAQMVSDGKLRPPAIEDFTLENAGDALAKIGGSHGAGKLVVVTR
ncbi:MAG: NADP-dependent oxidoreductase [Candidatus Dormiibacterota bacterium]